MLVEWPWKRGTTQNDTIARPGQKRKLARSEGCSSRQPELDLEAANRHRSSIDDALTSPTFCEITVEQSSGVSVDVSRRSVSTKVDSAV
jgi:hypothetical protein